MKHLGILASTRRAALCFRVFCQQGAGELSPPVMRKVLGTST